MTWITIIIAGVLTYFTRMTMIAIVRRDLLGDRIKEVLAFVPSAVFPAIIFPAIFLDSSGSFELTDNPKILAAIIATCVGIFSRSILATIFSIFCSTISTLMVKNNDQINEQKFEVLFGCSCVFSREEQE